MWLEAKMGNVYTEDTFSYDVAMLQTKVGDEDTENTLSHDVATLQTRVGMGIRQTLFLTT